MQACMYSYTLSLGNNWFSMLQALSKVDAYA